MELHELEDLMRARRSVRRWQDRPVPEELLLQALELAAWAPNGGGYQPYHFWLVTDRELITRMADAVQARADQMASWTEAQAFERFVSRVKVAESFFRGAPAVVAAATGVYQSAADRILELREPHDPEARAMRRARETADTGLQSLAAAIAYLCLVFQQMGLGACWMTGPLKAKAELEAMLGIPPEYRLAALIPVGYPAEEPAAKPRKPVREIVTVIRQTLGE